MISLPMVEFGWIDASMVATHQCPFAGAAIMWLLEEGCKSVPLTVCRMGMTIAVEER